MNSHTTIIVNWRGSFSYEEIEENPSLSNLSNGLYLATGKLKYQRGNPTIQYCGITERRFIDRFNDKNHKSHNINRDQEFWLGTIGYPDNYDRQHLEIAEGIIVYFWQPSLNERKKVSLPKPTTLINKWFKKDGTSRLRQDPICKELFDVISWDGDLWRGGNLRVWSEED